MINIKFFSYNTLFICARLTGYIFTMFTVQMKTKLSSIIKDYVIITFGLLLFAMGWLLFLIPAEITGGGISGVAAVVYFATKIPVSITFLTYKCGFGIGCHKNSGSQFWSKNHLQHCCFNRFFCCFSECFKKTAGR